MHEAWNALYQDRSYVGRKYTEHMFYDRNGQLEPLPEEP
jgi:hypothetical protein